MNHNKTICRLEGQELTDLLGSFMGEALECSIRVHGVSMDPFVRDGDVVKISPVSGDIVGTGDIVAVAPSGKASTRIHRVIGKRMSSGTMELLLKGDRCVYSDGWIPADNVQGIVHEVKRDDKVVKCGISGMEKYILALLSRTGWLIRCLGVGSRITGRQVIRPGIVSVVPGIILLTACCCMLAIAEDKPVSPVLPVAGAEGSGDEVKPVGRTPLVVLKQVEIQGQVFFIADKDGKQVPAEKIDIQVNSIDTHKKLFKTTTDADGKYTLPNFDLGKYQFLVGRLKLVLEITEPQKAGERVKRISKKIIVFIPEEMK